MCKQLNAYPQKDCPYKQQFIGLKDFPVVVAPIEYAFTKVLDKYQPHFTAVDDCLTRISEGISKDVIFQQLYWLAHFSGEPFEKDVFQEFINKPNPDNFKVKLNRTYRKFLKKITAEIKDGDTSGYRRYLLVSPQEIETYCNLAQIYGFRDRFSTPALFPLFDYVWENKTEDSEPQFKIIEAIPKWDFLYSIATRYQVEKNVTVNFYSDGFEPKIVDRGSIVYRYYGKKGAWYPTTSSIKE